MAAIVPVNTSNDPFVTLRNVSAQATTGQTDWLNIPPWAKSVTVSFNLTANAGTTPISTPSFIAADAISRDDGDVATILTGAAITGASTHFYAFGSYLTSAGTDSATLDSWVVTNTVLPALMGFKILNDRTTGNETYTYTLTVPRGS